MSEKEKYWCPFFPDMPCPQGKDAAEACQIRMQHDFDPLTDFRDFQMMECAIFRSQNRSNHSKNKAKGTQKNS